MDYLHEEPLQDVFFNPECLVPGKDGELVSRQGEIIDRTDFEKLKSEFYELRGWEVKSGLPTGTRLLDLELGDVAADLKARDLLR